MSMADGPGWLERQQQIAADRQQRRELLAAMPPAHKHAYELLTSKSIEVVAIVRVDPDAVLFLGPNGPRTGWLRPQKPGVAGSTRVCVEDGFPCEPGQTVLAAFGER